MSRQIPQSGLMPIEEALGLILARVEPLGAEEADMAAAHGRVLAEDVVSDVDSPPFRASAMDGYAVRAADLACASESEPVELVKAGEMMAGDSPMAALGPGTCVYAATGAAVPSEADAVVKVEETEARGERIVFTGPAAEGRHIRRVGEDVARGETVLRAGMLINAGAVGMLAGCGRTSAKVIRRPVVGIISTGSELVEPGQPLAPGKIRNTNAYTTRALVEKYGGAPRYLGIAPDDEARTRALILDGARDCDILLTSGGVSMGERDFVKDVIAELGEVGFWRVRMKPGKPFMFGSAGDCLIFGLPGFPTSSMVAFEVFVRPAVLKMQGVLEHRRPLFKARLSGDLPGGGSRRAYIRARVEYADGRWTAAPAPIQRSAALKSMVFGNGFIIVPEGAEAMGEGAEVLVELFDSLA